MPVFGQDNTRLVAQNPRPLSRDVFGRPAAKLSLWRRLKEWAIARAAAA